MCLGSKGDFSGGYDYKRKAGLIQISNHHISPGKKQWTWGNHEFGYAWDRNLTDGDGPYVELMLGVYTDNQPDFSFLQPGETKDWNVFWYPIQKIGPAHFANERVALSLRAEAGLLYVGVAPSEVIANAKVEVRFRNDRLGSWQRTLAPDQPLVETLSYTGKSEGVELVVWSEGGEEIACYQITALELKPAPVPATEPLPPEQVVSNDELYLIGLHLNQYRHATRSPLAYWQEALKRDGADSRCNQALGQWYLLNGQWAEAENYLRRAIARLTERNPNPYDGEAYYHLGLTLRYLERDDEAYAAFYKAIWNQAWQGAGYHALAEMDASRGHWHKALGHLQRSLRVNQDNLRARDLKVVVLRQLGDHSGAEDCLRETRALDRLDWWARYLAGDELGCDSQTCIDLALDCRRAGLLADAIKILRSAKSEPYAGTEPLIAYHLADLYARRGDHPAAEAWYEKGKGANLDYCFPARLEDELVLRAALARNPADGTASYLLGNLLYDKRRYPEAMAAWEKTVALTPHHAIGWRNLGIGYFNVQRDRLKAQHAYEQAFRCNPTDPRLLYERDQLCKRLGVAPEKRLAELEAHPRLVLERDDACIEWCALLNQTGHSDRAWSLLRERRFQPWEGGEGQTLGQFVRTALLLARNALKIGQADEALEFLQAALSPPRNLGEARHVLANASDLFLLAGDAFQHLGRLAEAQRNWQMASASTGDFQEMSVRTYSEMTYFSARALERLNEPEKAHTRFKELRAYAIGLEDTPAQIDYFATSLPTMLLFDDDLTFRQGTTARFIRAQADYGLGNEPAARLLLDEVLVRDPNHAAASDLRAELS
jgi:tetratricopeptide (TPR) repeat protein